MTFLSSASLSRAFQIALCMRRVKPKTALIFSHPPPPFFSFRLRGQSRLGWRGSGRKDVLLLRVARRPDPRTVWAVSAGLHGGDPGGAAVRGPVEALPWHWHGDDNHQGGQVYTTHARVQKKEKKLTLFIRKCSSISEKFYLKKIMHPHLSVVCLIMSLSHTHAHTPLRSVWRVIMCFTCRPLSVQAFMSRQVIPDVGEPAELLLINPSETKFPTFSSLFIANSPKKQSKLGSWPADPAGRDLYPRGVLPFGPPVEKKAPKGS